MWHVSSRSGVATLRTAIHLLLTYLTPPPPKINPSYGLGLSRRPIVAAMCSWFATELWRVYRSKSAARAPAQQRAASCCEPRYDAQHRLAAVVNSGREPDSKILEEMVAEAPGPINFTMFLGLFGDRLKGRLTDRSQ